MSGLFAAPLGGFFAWLFGSFRRKPSAAATEAPPWLARALSHEGFNETGVNQGIERFIALARCGARGDPWCAIFVNACVEAAGLRGTRSAMARSFETSAHFVKLAGPARGAIGTMWRRSKSSRLGHVFFYLGHDAHGRVIGLAGNQSDGVRRAYQDADRMVGWYWPKGGPLPTIGRVAYVEGDVNAGGAET